MTKLNAIGVISMFYARPFGREHFSTLRRMKKAGADVVELLVPEPDELDSKETRAAAADAGLSIVLAARVNLARDLASADQAAHACRRRIPRGMREHRRRARRDDRRRPALRAPRSSSPAARRTRCEPAERRRRIDAVVRGLAQAARRAADQGVVARRRAARIASRPTSANTSRHALELVERSDHLPSASCSTPFT